MKSLSIFSVMISLFSASTGYAQGTIPNELVVEIGKDMRLAKNETNEVKIETTQLNNPKLANPIRMHACVISMATLPNQHGSFTSGQVLKIWKDEVSGRFLLIDFTSNKRIAHLACYDLRRNHCYDGIDMPRRMDCLRTTVLPTEYVLGVLQARELHQPTAISGPLIEEPQGAR